MPRINLTIEPQLFDNILKHKPKSLSTARFCSLLIEQKLEGLDNTGEMAKNLEQPDQTQTQRDVCSEKEITAPPVSISRVNAQNGSSGKRKTAQDGVKAAFAAVPLPDPLEPSRERFIKYGLVKKGDRGEHGAKLAATGLRQIGEKYGWQVAVDQLDLAINARWQGISLANYERFLPKPKAEESIARHPASRVFTAARGFEDEPTTNPILQGMF